ncbi:MAG: ABC transporter ATP-binding protein [Lentisphaeria bacterium]|nr:ABC transporter ATP-binding protein [Lentisphaeria bacterium]
MLECKNLEFSYDGKNKVLSGVTLSFERGKFYGIFGPNGSGKSTLMKLLTNEIKSTGGTVSPLWRSPLERARNIALVEQQIPSSLPLTVAETVALGRYPWERNCEAEIECVREILDRLELVSLAKRPFNALSGGEKQRVMLARALVQNTPILCLDEPGSALDIGFQHTLCRILKELASEGKCVIMISHDFFSAPGYLDRMILLNKGKVAACGNFSELKGKKIIRDIFDIPDGVSGEFF